MSDFVTNVNGGTWSNFELDVLSWMNIKESKSKSLCNVTVYQSLEVIN